MPRSGVDLDGHKDILGMWFGDGGGKSAKFWLAVFTELRNRGVANVLFLVCRCSVLTEHRTAAYTCSNGRLVHPAISSITRSVIREMVSFGHPDTADLGEMSCDVAGGQPAGTQRQHDLARRRSPAQRDRLLAMLPPRELEVLGTRVGTPGWLAAMPAWAPASGA
jgi:hypothetical protein